MHLASLQGVSFTSVEQARQTGPVGGQSFVPRGVSCSGRSVCSICCLPTRSGEAE